MHGLCGPIMLAMSLLARCKRKMLFKKIPGDKGDKLCMKAKNAGGRPGCSAASRWAETARPD